MHALRFVGVICSGQTITYFLHAVLFINFKTSDELNFLGPRSKVNEIVYLFCTVLCYIIICFLIVVCPLISSFYTAGNNR